MIYKIYIIYSLTLDRYYIGHTENIVNRLAQHNSGISKYTSAVNDWELVYSEEYETRNAAHERELQIKRKKSRKYIEWLISSAG